VCFGKDESEAFSGGLDCTVQRIGLDDGEQTVLSTHSKAVSCVAYSPEHCKQTYENDTRARRKLTLYSNPRVWVMGSQYSLSQHSRPVPITHCGPATWESPRDGHKSIESCRGDDSTSCTHIRPTRGSILVRIEQKWQRGVSRGTQAVAAARIVSQVPNACCSMHAQRRGLCDEQHRGPRGG